jgi:hypothetical protein
MTFEFESARVISDKGRRWRQAMDVCDVLDIDCHHSNAVFLSERAAQKCTSRVLANERQSFTKGTIGAYMAHQEVWRAIAASQNKESWHVVLEDDVSLPDMNTNDVQKRITDEMNAATALGNDFVQLGGSKGLTPALHAYALRPSAASRLFEISAECGAIERSAADLARDACRHNEISCARMTEDIPNRSYTRTDGILKQLKRTNDNPSHTRPLVRDQQRLLD